MNEEEEETIDAVNTTSDVVHAIIDEVIPYSVEYFLGIREDDYGMDDEDFDDEGDEDEDEDDEESGKKKKTKKPIRKGSGKDAAGGAGGAGEQKPECKQQ